MYAFLVGLIVSGSFEVSLGNTAQPPKGVVTSGRLTLLVDGADGSLQKLIVTPPAVEFSADVKAQAWQHVVSPMGVGVMGSF